MGTAATLAESPDFRLYKRQGACDLLQCSETTLDFLIHSGQIPVVRMGRSVRITARALREYIEQLESEVC